MKLISPISNPHASTVNDAQGSGGTFYLVLMAGLFLATEFVVLNGGLYLLGRESVLTYVGQWLSAEAKGDSWWPMKHAYDFLYTRQPGNLYGELVFNEGMKFQYAPTSLLLFIIPEHLGLKVTIPLLNGIGWLFVIIEAGSLAALALLMGKSNGMVGDDWRSRSICAGIAALVSFTFFPVMKSYGLGQIQTWINACFALACLCWLVERKAIAGILIGLICLAKPQFTLFMVWGGMRRQWTFLAGWAVVVVPGVAASIYAFGLATHLEYVDLLQYISRRGETYYPNQTINGLLNRMLGNGDNLHFQDYDFAPYNSVVYAGTFISSAGLVLLSLFWRAWRRSPGVLDFLIAGLTFTMASPVGWHHHYGILPAAFVALFFAIADLRRSSSRSRLFFFLGIAFIFSANYFTITNELAETPVNFLQSYLLFAALIVLCLLYRLRDAAWMRRSDARMSTLSL